MQLKLSAKLYAATAAALILMLMLVGINAYSNRSSQDALAEVFEHTVKPLLAVQAIDRSLQEVRFRVAGVILDQLPRAGARIHLKEAREAIPQQWKVFVDSNRADNPDEIALIRKIESGLASTSALFDKIDKLYDADDRKGLGAVIEDDWPQVTTQIVKPLGELIGMQTRQMGETYAASRQRGEKLSSTALAIFALTVLLMLAGAFFVVRSITGPAREVERVLADVAGGNLTVRAEVLSRDEIGAMAVSLNATVEALNATLTGVHRAADRLAGNADSLSGEAAKAREDTQMQTDNVMQISAAMQQLTVSVAEISGRARDVADASARTREIARSSAAAVQHSTQTTGRALQAVAASSAAVGELSSEIDKISAITMVIKEIADQTNLLALNAAIEAARAGESGRGFAVVADEVRKLAERTTASTGDITRMIQAIQEKTRTAVGAMEAVSVDVRQGAEQTGQLDQSFAGILEAADRLNGLAGEIADGTNEQTQVAQQTARSMEGISQASERTGGRVRQVAATAAETAGTAQELKRLVDRFRVQ